jgi:hypothetical protein
MNQFGPSELAKLLLLIKLKRLKLTLDHGSMIMLMKILLRKQELFMEDQ